MLDVGRGWAGDLHVNVVVVPLAAVTGRHYGVGIEIDAADEPGRRLVTGIHNPAFLMLTRSRMCAIPSDAETGVAVPELRVMRRRAPERVGPEPGKLLVWSPENHSYVQTAG